MNYRLDSSDEIDLGLRKSDAQRWFKRLQSRLMDTLEALEREADPELYPGQSGHFIRTPWRRAPTSSDHDQGGGVMGMMRGRLFEKVGLHISTVYGALSPEFAKTDQWSRR